ncbi:MAG: antibiotic biosynthesis monooxygenase [Chloroflexota bacterium]
MYTRIINFKIRPGSADELRRIAEQDTVPFLKGLRGFHGEHMVQVSETEIVSFETWENKESADASRQAVEQHIRQRYSHILTSSPSFSEGQLIVHGAGHEPHHHPGPSLR